LEPRLGSCRWRTVGPNNKIPDGIEVSQGWRGANIFVILDQGEEAFKSITDFANREKISGASVSAIGAFLKAKVGWFDLSLIRNTAQPSTG
jgi:predicted DNA-binding protein with PD1-like motif